MWRWGGAIAALLVVQSVLLAGLFWVLATGSHQREVERHFSADCRALAALPASARRAELRAMLGRDIHRDRFLALFTADRRLIDGNVAQLPDGAHAGRGSFVAPVRPTELPGKTGDVARLALCAMPDGATLLTGVDLDDAEEALRVVERSLLIGLVPGILLALGFGLIAGRRAARQVDAGRRLTERIVADEGPGVSVAERSLVTQRFYRGRHEREGAGLGLSLVKAIADLHGFTLRFVEHDSAVSLLCPAPDPESEFRQPSCPSSVGVALEASSWALRLRSKGP